MEIIDLTHQIEENMPVYPGTEPPVIKQANTIEKDGFAEKLLSLYSHTGTHMDAPRHIFDGAKSVSDFTPDSLYGRACVMDFSSVKGVITADILKKYADRLEDSDIAVFYTGWDRYWGEDAYFSDFPVMDVDAAKYLVSKKMKGVAVDAISVDSVDCYELDVHRVILGAGMFITENLCGLKELMNKEFDLGVFPLKIKDGDGAPVRAIGFCL